MFIATPGSWHRAPESLGISWVIGVFGSSEASPGGGWSPVKRSQEEELGTLTYPHSPGRGGAAPPQTHPHSRDWRAAGCWGR